MLIKIRFLQYLITLFTLLKITSAQIYVQPEQIRLSHGGKPGSLTVTWITFNNTNESLVEYGEGHLDRVKSGHRTKFVDGGPQKRHLYIHRVILDDLSPGKTYIYHVGSQWGWSAIFSTSVLKSGTDWSPRFAVFGDMGNKNARSLARLQQGAQRGDFDMVLHVGDMAYDMDTENARFGDEFSRQIEPIAAYVPYMTVVGNHENAYNFSNYVNRFSMPNGESNLFYSFDLGPAHFVAFSTEFYFFVKYGWTQIVNQFEWLNEDLKVKENGKRNLEYEVIHFFTQKANLNRKNVPWIITMGHRPMYCSNWDSDDCTKYESIIRGGLPYIHAYALEPLFYKYGVDLSFWAHEHSYERMYPLYNRTVYNSSNDPYLEPQAPVHIITGSAGCQENTDAFVPSPPPWSAFRSSEYGYSRMTIYNGSHLYLEQISDDRNGQVIDRVWIRKQNHGSYLRFEGKLRDIGHHVPYDIEPPSWYKGRCAKCSQL